ncbi:hypothetical protein G7046_g2060 [Stylonectria norvegica]|nr:hypothetical protein G7046_g2060 [Stylonectria norvegica]
MASLAALGVAASIAQFTMIGLQGASFVLKAYRSTSGLLEEQQDLLSITEDVQKHFKALSEESSSEIDDQLRTMLDKARSSAVDLVAELTRLKRVSDEGHLFRLRQAFRAARKKSKLEEMYSRLIAMRNEASFALLAAMKQSRSSLLAQFSSLNSKVYDINSQLVGGLDEMSSRLRSLETAFTSRAAADKEFAIIANEAQSLAARGRMRHHMEGVLRSLHFKQISERLSEIKEAHSNTCHWSLSDDKTSLADWLKSGQGIYWIEGKAGSGKSTLMKFLTKEPQTRHLLDEWRDSRPLVVVNHFFWGPGTDLQRGINGLFRTLLFQILIASPEMIADVCLGRTDQTSFQHLESWTTDELRACFQRLAALNSLPTKMCFFIDGLDEFHGSQDDLMQILNIIAQCRDMKLCVSSRPWREFQVAFGSLPGQLHVQDLTKDDILCYVGENLSQSQHYTALQSEFPTEAASFRDEIVSRAEGVFLWVYLVTRSLLRGMQYQDSITILRQRLREFPTELEDYFQAMLESIEPVYWKETSEMLSMLAYSKSPLPIGVVITYPITHDDLQRLHDECALLHSDRQPLSFELDYEVRDAFGPEWLDLFFQRRNLDLSEAHHNQITARCKDLVHMHAASESSLYEDTIGFLHRSVADFLTLPRSAAILKDRHDHDFEPKLALAEGYAHMLWLEWRNGLVDRTEQNLPIMKAHRYFLWILYLASELKGRSRALFNKTMLLLLMTLTGLQHLKIDLNAWPILTIHPLVRPDQQHRGVAKAFDLTNVMVHINARLGVLWPSCDWQLADHSAWTMAAVQYIRYCNLQPQSYRLHDPYGDVDLQPFPAILGKGLSLQLSENNEPTLTQINTIHLEGIQEALQRPRVIPLLKLPRFPSIWLRCLEYITAMERDELPSNIYEACRILIAAGAPRYVVPDRDRHVRELFTPRQLQVWDVADIKITALDFPVIDSARILDQIPEIGSRSPNGMEEMFINLERPDLEDKTEVESQGLLAMANRSVRGIFAWL